MIYTKNDTKQKKEIKKEMIIMLKKEENQKTITQVENMITTINTILNKSIAESDTNNDLDKIQLRKIRDENINTYILIQKLRMVDLI